MRKFVRHDMRDVFFLFPGCRLGVNQQPGLTEKHQAAVFHRARRKPRHRHLVILVEVVGHVEIGFVPGQQPRSVLLGKLAHMFLAAQRPDP